jgi:hypothetical protein
MQADLSMGRSSITVAATGSGKIRVLQVGEGPRSFLSAIAEHETANGRAQAFKISTWCENLG